MNIALFNTNRIRPPIGPIGLEYLAEAISRDGHRVEFLDLCWSADVMDDIRRFFREREYNLVGLSLRNTDDCVAASGVSFLPAFAQIVEEVRRNTEAPVALGGVGFSTMPETVMEHCHAHLGVWGDGERTFARLADRIETGQPWEDLPNLVVPGGSGWRRTPMEAVDLERLPPMRREWVDNPRYFREGGQAGFETKRGCPGQCVYCADPVAKGHRTRMRSPGAVADELAYLLGQGIDHFHTCDSEFNMPEEHALAVCREIIRRGLGARIRWYAYCAPAPFSRELARLMRNAGCAGINFGVDSGDEEMLRRLGRGFGPGAIADCVALCKDFGMASMLDLLLGSPGESEASIRRTLDLMKRIMPDRVGVALGVRVYPGTPLSRRLKAPGTGQDFQEGEIPGFYTDPRVADSAPGLIDRMIAGDRRFLFYDPTRPDRDYNYNANEVLLKAIENGYRGAYWDILRRVAENRP